MAWLSWLPHCIIFQIRKRIDRPEVYIVFCLVIFLFNQPKNNAYLEPRTEHFRGPVGFEAKNFKMCPRGQGRPRGLHLR